MKRAAWILSGFLVLVLLIAGMSWIVVSRSEDPFYAYLEQRHAAGLPVSFAELDGPPPAESENGAPALDAAVKKLLREHGPSSSWKYSPFDVQFLLPEDAPWPDYFTDEQRAELARRVATFRPWSAERDAALAKPRLRLPPRMDLAGMPTDDVTLVLQNAQKIVAMQAAAESDAGERLAACRALLLMGRRAGDGPLVRRMVGMACISSGAHCLRHAASTGAIDPSAARVACDELLRGSSVDDVRRAIKCFAVDVIEQYRAVVEGRVPSASDHRSGWNWAEHKLDDLWSSIRDKPRRLEPESGMARSIVEICRGLDAAADADAATLTSQPATWRLAHGDVLRRFEMDQLLARTMRNARRTDAVARLARVGLAVVEHRGKHGDYPSSLDELKPAFPDGVPTDPFTDAPFVYEKTPTGARIATAGRAEGDPAVDATELRASGLVWELKR
jgi:hypothetical protein